jgi:hypothetical protein
LPAGEYALQYRRHEIGGELQKEIHSEIPECTLQSGISDSVSPFTPNIHPISEEPD